MTLKAPRGLDTRPTLGRVRESLFMILMPWLPDARLLDAYAGSGALGLEGLSRGAARCVFLESGRDAVEALRFNIERLEMNKEATVLTGDAGAYFKRGPREGEGPFDVI